jgi:hypothetical protein
VILGAEGWKSLPDCARRTIPQPDGVAGRAWADNAAEPMTHLLTPP